MTKFTKILLFCIAIVYCLVLWGLAFAQNTEGLTFTDVSVSTGKVYDLQPGPVVGGKQYADRIYTFTNVPESLHDAVYFIGHNDDKTNKDPSLLKFTTNHGIYVYVGIDSRINPKPAWLVIDYQATGEKLISTEHTLNLYKKEVDGGTPVSLPGLGVTSSNYVVIVKTKTERRCVSGDYRLLWSLGTEPDLSEYTLYRSSGLIVDDQGNLSSAAEAFATIQKPFPLVSPTPDLGPTVTSPKLSQDPGLNYYVVTAKDTSGNESGPSNVVGCLVVLPILLQDPVNLRVE